MELLDQLVVELFRGVTDLQYRVLWLTAAALSFLWQGFKTEHHP